MIDAVIFDVDGTLVNTVDFHAESWQRTFEKFGHSIEFATIRAQIGKGGDQLLPALLSEAVVEREGEAMERFRKDLFAKAYMPRVQSFTGVRELFLRVCADSKRVALASSAKGDELTTYKRAAQIEDLVDEASTSDDADRSKPFPDIFQAALNRLDVAPGKVVVIGDTPYDAQAAGSAGMATIGVLCGGFAEADLKDAGCVVVYRDPADILRNYDSSILGTR